MILIVASKVDVASMNIAKQILEHYDFEKTSETFHQNPIYQWKAEDKDVKLVFLNQDLIHTQFITEHFKPQLLIFISRHSSTSGTPTLSVHTPGNLGEAKYGGIPRKVSVSPASAMKNALLEMQRQKEEKRLDYEVSYECTHHGPSLDVPSMFVELGSSLIQWKDMKAAEAVAYAAIAAATRGSTYPTVLGIGGPHYNMKFTKTALETSTAFGHMIPKYAVSELDVKILRQCVERTLEKVDAAFIDWKGIKGAHKDKLLSILDMIGIAIQKV